MLRIVQTLFACAAAVNSGWEVQPSSKEEAIHLTFAIKQQNTAELLKRFDEISDPTHASYGAHLSLEEVDSLLRPRIEDIAVVEDLLRGLDVQRTTGGDFLTATTTVSHAERILAVTFLKHCHSDLGCRFRAQEPTLPKSLASAIDFVSPWNEPLPKQHEQPPRYSETLSLNQPKVTPQWLRDAYRVGDVHGNASRNKQAVAAFDGEMYGASKLQGFFKRYWTSATGNTISNFVGDGPTTGRSPTNEGDLDVQYLMSIGDNVKTEWWSFASSAPKATSVEPFLKFLTTLGNTSDAPFVVSFSYGDVETEVPVAYAQRCNIEFQKAGVRGISLLFASGDGGVAGNRPVAYCGNTGCALAGPKGACFVPTWPATSPYVTAVGGTARVNGARFADGQSCGGFSYLFKRPNYQDSAVQAYLAKNSSSSLPDHARFNPDGRGFPDIAGMFRNYQIYEGGLFPISSIGGTSASTPVVAGIVSLLNDLRLQKSSSPLGFLNPLLYQNAEVLQDITQGSNGGVDCSAGGFPATEGWDGVTGLGEPDYVKLAQLVLATAPKLHLVV